MRKAFIETLSEIAAGSDRIWLLTGDLGFSVLEDYSQQFADRFLNLGIAEQNMTGVAAGLALSGKIPFTYSIANFPVMRCLEQVRNDVCYHYLNVNIIGIGGGFDYGSAGYTHHAVEDIAVMRALPGMTVVAPGDATETRLATAAIVNHEGPCYMRLGKSPEAVHEAVPGFELGKAIEVQEGSDVTLVASGGVLGMVVQAARTLSGKGLSVQILSMPTIKPLDARAVEEAAAKTGRIVSVEDHGRGGLGSAIAEVLAEGGLAAKFVPIFLPGAPEVKSGSQQQLCAMHGLSVEDIAKTVLDVCSHD